MKTNGFLSLKKKGIHTFGKAWGQPHILASRYQWNIFTDKWWQRSLLDMIYVAQNAPPGLDFLLGRAVQRLPRDD